MFSILYVADGRIFQIGPFNTETEAIAAGKTAQAEGEFDSQDQYVYLIRGDNLNLISLSSDDLEAE